MMNNICVYRHIRLDRNEVFYIGIGNEYRPNRKDRRNKYWNNIINKTDYRVDILFEDLTWEEACEKEKEFIKLYGRKDLGLGTLSNMTDGGDGVYGMIHTDESKRKISKAAMGRTQSQETYDKLSKIRSGKKHSKEWCDNISKSLSKKPIIQYDMSGNKIKEWVSHSKAASELNLQRRLIGKVCYGERISTGGFIWRFKEDSFNKYTTNKIDDNRDSRTGRFKKKDY